METVGFYLVGALGTLNVFLEVAVPH